MKEEIKNRFREPLKYWGKSALYCLAAIGGGIIYDYCGLKKDLIPHIVTLTFVSLMGYESIKNDLLVLKSLKNKLEGRVDEN